jgi:hypothetical protein
VLLGSIGCASSDIKAAIDVALAKFIATRGSRAAGGSLFFFFLLQEQYRTSRYRPVHTGRSGASVAVVNDVIDFIYFFYFKTAAWAW